MGSRFIQFAAAGIIGFVIDASVLYTALAAGVDHFTGRLISFVCAVWVTWQLNRRMAFRDARSRSGWSEWWRYLAAMSGGGIVNYIAYSLCIWRIGTSAFAPLVAVAMGSIVGMTVNFATSKFWVFRQANGKAHL